MTKHNQNKKQGTSSTSEAGWALDPPQPMAGSEALAPKSRTLPSTQTTSTFCHIGGLQHRSVFVVTRIILNCLSSVQSSFGKDRSFEFEITKFRASTLTSHRVHQILTSTTHKCLLWRKTPCSCKVTHTTCIWYENQARTQLPILSGLKGELISPIIVNPNKKLTDSLLLRLEWLTHSDPSSLRPIDQ